MSIILVVTANPKWLFNSSFLFLLQKTIVGFGYGLCSSCGPIPSHALITPQSPSLYKPRASPPSIISLLVFHKPNPNFFSQITLSIFALCPLPFFLPNFKSIISLLLSLYPYQTPLHSIFFLFAICKQFHSLLSTYIST